MKAFLTIAIIHFLALASPGPDFVIIMKQSITQNRRIALWTACGISLGILLHVGYSLLGIGFVVSHSILLFNTLKLLGAAYLLFIGWKSLFAHPEHFSLTQETRAGIGMSTLQAVRVGFLCNAFNPKVTLFFFALFTQVIDSSTQLSLQLFYGMYMSAMTFAWFAALGILFSAHAIRRRMDAFHLWAERLMGAVLIALGLKVALATRE